MKLINNSNDMSLWQLKERFTIYQRTKGSSKASISTYNSGFKKINQWLAFEVPKNEVEYKKVLKNYDVDEYGAVLPISLMCMDDADYKFRCYLEDVCELAPYTVRSYMVTWRVILYYCFREKILPERRIEIKKTPAPIKNCYTKAEIDRLLRKPNPDNFAAYRSWLVINHILSTGNRLGSIIDIKVKDIDFDENYINVNTQKNKRPMRVPLVNKYKMILIEYVNNYRVDENGVLLDDEYLFCNRYGEHLSEVGLQASIARYNNSRGVFKTSVHLLRHTFAKEYIMSGGDIFSLKKILGHSSLGMVENYSNLYGTDLKKQAEQHAAITHTKTRSGRTLTRRK